VRAKLSAYFAQLQPVRVVMEACGSAHHWARVLGALGHEVELLPARQVRAFVRSNKDDAADARAIWLAAQQSDIRRAPIKSQAQQAVQALHRTRQHWVSVRTATVQRLVDGQLATLKDMARRIDELEAEIGAQQRELDWAMKLREVPGIGLLGATALAATLGDARAWKSGRDFSASLGLVPAHAGTGGKTRVGHLSKRGDPYLRTLLMHGARSVIASAKNKPKWLEQLLARRPMNVAVAALANKMARTAWALVAHGRDYEREWKSTPPKGCVAQAAAA